MKILNMCLSGSHLYGWNAQDSDVDLRGTFLAPTSDILSLFSYKDVLEFKEGKTDIVLFEIAKEVGLALKGNCNSLERLNAPQIITTFEFEELKRIINSSFGKKGVYNSYKGMATSSYKKYISNGKGEVKKFLVIMRALMAGVYTLRSGRIEPDIRKLNETFKIGWVERLLKLKEKDKHKIVKDEGVSEWFYEIDKAYKESTLPEKTRNYAIEQADNFIIKLRRGE